MPKLNVFKGVAAQWESDRANMRGRDAEAGKDSRKETARQVTCVLGQANAAAAEHSPVTSEAVLGASFAGKASSEPLLYHWQRNDQLEQRLEQIATTSPKSTGLPVPGSIEAHCGELQRFLQDTDASDMRTARNVVTTMSRFVAEADALALKAAYNDRARAFGKELFDLSSQI